MNKVVIAKWKKTREFENKQQDKTLILKIENVNEMKDCELYVIHFSSNVIISFQSATYI